MGKRRVFLIVLDSYGIGAEPDADLFGDIGSNTLKTIAGNAAYDTPVMKSMGLFNIDGRCGFAKGCIRKTSGEFDGQGYDHRPLGDGWSYIREAFSNIS